MFKVKKNTHTLNIGAQILRFTFFKRYYFRGLPNRMFSFVKMKEKQAQLYKKNTPNQNATTIHHIQLHGGKRKSNKNTQTVRDIHIKQELNKKSSNLLLLSPRRDRE